MPDARPPSPPFELALVIPVYNEEACIARVLNEWRDTLATLSIRFRILVLNDGSSDGTAAALIPFERDTRFLIAHKSNSGHGPTILQGYREAVEQADWVFQCDSDDEIPPSEFTRFWESRARYDALFGQRTRRHQAWDRWLITRVSRVLIGLLFGFGVQDVNVPFRLFRRETLTPLLALIPPDTFAPNLVLSGAVARGRARVANIPVSHVNRRTGKASLASMRLWRAAGRSLLQTLAVARACRARVPRSS
jgi:dolichol-phosphate mannosyltransferase